MTYLSLTPEPVEAPCPLNRIKAIHKAHELHRKGWSWTSIAKAMGEYHGQYAGPWSWRAGVQSLGLPVRKRVLTPAKADALLRLQAVNRGDVDRPEVTAA